MDAPVSEPQETSLFVCRSAWSSDATQSALRALHRELRLRGQEARPENDPANSDDRRELHDKPRRSFPKSCCSIGSRNRASCLLLLRTSGMPKTKSLAIRCEGMEHFSRGETKLRQIVSVVGG